MSTRSPSPLRHMRRRRSDPNAGPPGYGARDVSLAATAQLHHQAQSAAATEPAIHAATHLQSQPPASPQGPSAKPAAPPAPQATAMATGTPSTTAEPRG